MTESAFNMAEETFIGDESNENISPDYIVNLMETYSSNPFIADVSAEHKEIDFDANFEQVVDAIEEIWKGFLFNDIETFVKVIDLACLDQALSNGFKNETDYRKRKS